MLVVEDGAHGGIVRAVSTPVAGRPPGIEGRIVRLVGVYDADGTLRGEVTYWVGARLGRRHCSLCDITHGSIRRRPEWTACTDGLAVPFDTYHRNDQPEAVRAAAGGAAPVVVAEITTDDVTTDVTPDVISDVTTDVTPDVISDVTTGVTPDVVSDISIGDVTSSGTGGAGAETAPTHVMLLGPGELEACDASIERLMESIEAAATRLGLRWPAI
jgi:hypothetical protein